jgi:hypothetical protein
VLDLTAVAGPIAAAGSSHIAARNLAARKIAAG